MARLVQTGFESGGLEACMQLRETPTVVTSQKRTGYYSLYINGFMSVFLDFGGGYTEIYFRVGYRHHTTNGNGPFLSLQNTNGWNVLTFCRNSSGAIDVRLGGCTDSVIATGGSLPQDQWKCIEGHVVIDGTNGVVDVKVNGALVIEFDGDTEVDAAAPDLYAAEFGYWNVTHNVVCHFDDIAVNSAAGSVNNSWIGQGGIIGLYPNAAGEYTQLTPSAGNNYECVDERPPSDADYVYSATGGLKDLYNLTPCALAPGTTIKAISWVGRARNTQSGATAVTRLIRTASTDYAGAEAVPIDTEFQGLTEVIEQNPNTSANWSLADLDALQAGVVL